MSKKISPADITRIIAPGSRIFIGTGCSEPIILTRQLVRQKHHFSDCEIIHFLTLSDNTDISIEGLHGRIGITADDTTADYRNNIGRNATRNVNDFLYFGVVAAQTGDADHIDFVFGDQMMEGIEGRPVDELQIGCYHIKSTMLQTGGDVSDPDRKDIVPTGGLSGAFGHNK